MVYLGNCEELGMDGRHAWGKLRRTSWKGMQKDLVRTARNFDSICGPQGAT